jgi:hypothetical protein
MTSYKSYKKVERKQVVLMNEQTFPSLEPLQGIKEISTNIPYERNYKDKLQPIKPAEEEKPIVDSLPPGWIVLDGKRRMNKIYQDQIQEEIKEEKIDLSHFVLLCKKRKERYLSLYGEDNYKKIFGYYPFYRSDNEYSENEEFLGSENEISSFDE